MGLDFLDFLRSGEKASHTFAESQRERRRWSCTREREAETAGSDGKYAAGFSGFL